HRLAVLQEVIVEGSELPMLGIDVHPYYLAPLPQLALPVDLVGGAGAHVEVPAVLVIHRDEHMGRCRQENVERNDEGRDVDRFLIVVQRFDAGESEAVWSVLVLIKPGRWAKSVVALVEARYLCLIPAHQLVTRVEHVAVDVLDGALDGLDVVAGVVDLANAALIRGYRGPPEVRERRLLLLRAHVDPDHVALLHDREGSVLDVEAHPALGRLAGSLQDVPVHVDLPAVVEAADPALLVSAEEEGGLTVGTTLFHDADMTVAVAKCNEVLAEEPDADWVTVRLRQLLRETTRHPCPADELAHWGPGPGSHDQFCIFHRQHGSALSSIRLMTCPMIRSPKRRAQAGSPSTASVPSDRPLVMRKNEVLASRSGIRYHGVHPKQSFGVTQTSTRDGDRPC